MVAPILPAFSLITALHGIFALCLCVVALTTAAFYYHWARFSPTHAGAIATIAIYTIGLVLLVFALLGVMAVLA